MSWEAWTTLGVLVMVVGLLVGTRRSPDVILLGALALLLISGVLRPSEALVGFANEGMATIGVLFAVAAGLRETGALHWVARLLGRPRSLFVAQVRIMLPAGIMSAFMNNTPLVAILLPVIGDWAKRTRFAASRILIPLSFASILGGACTLVGTSTNLVVNGWLLDEVGHAGLGMFELAWVGVPCALAGIGFVLLAGRRLLPDRSPPIDIGDDPRSYTVETLVQPAGPLVGKTVEAAGLRHLPGVYLMEIERAGETIPAVAPDERLCANDRLIFVGVVESVVDLHKIAGLLPATEQVFKIDAPRSRRCLIEAVVSDSCPLVGCTIREGRFRTRYNAVVVAVARSGRRIRIKIGDIVLQPGDTLLLEALPAFIRQHRNSRDFYLVSQVRDSNPPRYERAPVALVILGLLVAVVAMGWLSMFKGALVAAGLMLATRCCSASAVRRAVDWQVLLVVAAAIGIGRAMQTSGLADVLAQHLVAAAGPRPTIVLAAVYGVTMLLAGLITAKAAALLMLPLAHAAAGALGVAFMPFAMGVLYAASTTVATPVGYPTNLMIFGPGGYRFRDYLRIGVPISLILWGIVVALVPRVWPF